MSSSPLVLEQLDSVAALRAIAPAWDALWARSEVTIPNARAELVAQWVEHFAPDAAFLALTVRQNSELRAALPLIEQRCKGVLHVGGLTGNYWSPNGELLLDPAVEPQAVLDLLAGALDAGPWPLLWLDMTPVESPHWQTLLAALTRRGLAVDVHPRYRIGLVDFSGNFAEYEHRRLEHMQRGMRRALRQDRMDGLELSVYRQFSSSEIEPLLYQAFEIERRSWKEDAGGAVLSTPRMFEFYLRQARQLADWGLLQLAFLCLGSRPIAFELGWTAKGVYHCFKVGYDAAHRGLRPGHVLRKLVIQSLFSRPEMRRVDFQGPLTDAIAAWSTNSYPIARVVVAPRRLRSRVLLTGYRSLATVVRRFRISLQRRGPFP